MSRGNKKSVRDCRGFEIPGFEILVSKLLKNVDKKTKGNGSVLEIARDWK